MLFTFRCLPCRVWHPPGSGKVRRRSPSPLSPDINTALPLLLVHLSFTSSRFPASVPLSTPGPWSALSTPLRARTATHTHHTCTHSQHAPVESDLFTTISIPRGAGLHLSSHRWRWKLDQARLPVYRTLLFSSYTPSNTLASRTPSLPPSPLLALSQLAATAAASYWALALVALRIGVAMTKAPAQWTWRSHGLDQSNICLMFPLRFLSTAPPTYGRRWTLESGLVTPPAWIQPRLIGQPSRGQLSWSFRHLLVLTWQRLDYEDMHMHCPVMPGSAIRLLEVWRFHVPFGRALFTRASYSARFRTRGGDGLSCAGAEPCTINGEAFCEAKRWDYPASCCGETRWRHKVKKETGDDWMSKGEIVGKSHPDRVSRRGGAQWESSCMWCWSNTRSQRLEAVPGRSHWCERNDWRSAIGGLWSGGKRVGFAVRRLQWMACQPLCTYTRPLLVSLQLELPSQTPQPKKIRLHLDPLASFCTCVLQ